MRRTAVLIAAAALLGPLVWAGGAQAATEPTVLVSVTGTVELLTADTLGAGGTSTDSHRDLVTQALITVNGELYTLPAPAVADLSQRADLRTGDDVQVTLRAERGLTRTAALQAAAAGDPGATVVAVTETPASAAQPEVAGTQGSVLGAHSLTVLPVYWSAPDGATQSSLTQLASGVATYWSEQSGGRLDIRPTVAPWLPITDPGSCDTGKIFGSALAANGMTSPTGTAHVVVYFPKRSDCGGWAGAGTVSGGKIWVNGVPLPDVVAHEFGHNLGLGHANTATCTAGAVRAALSDSCSIEEYGDKADPMGSAAYQATGNLNAAFADYLGWVSVVPVPSLPATVNLAPLSEFGAGRTVKLATGYGTVYVDFRPAQGRDVRKPGWAGVQVHRLVTEYGLPQTQLLDMEPTTTTPFSAADLPVGGSWEIPGTDQVLTVTAISPTQATIGLASTGPGQPPANGADVVGLTPARVLANPNVAPGAVQCVLIAARYGLPAGATSVLLNVTTVDPTGPGSVLVYPDSEGTGLTAPPAGSTVNFEPGAAVANAAFVPLPADGKVCYSTRNAARVGVLFDLTGYTLPGSGVTTQSSVRVADTRSGPGHVGPVTGPIAPRTPLEVQVTGAAGIPASALPVPAGATGVLLNVTITGARSPGNLRVYPAGAGLPDTSVVNYVPGQDKANATIVALPASGRITLYSDTDAGADVSPVNVVLDVVGYTTTGSSYTPLTPTRLLNTTWTDRPSQLSGPLTARTGYSFVVGESGAVPATATAVVLNVTAISPNTTGNLRVYPGAAGTVPPYASVLNYRPGSDTPNLVLVPVTADGRVNLYSDQGPGDTVQVAVDVVGYVAGK
jgi:hypothetical protein